ncbi:hypothetical protein [Methylobacterium sp. A54F]
MKHTSPDEARCASARGTARGMDPFRGSDPARTNDAARTVDMT